MSVEQADGPVFWVRVDGQMAPASAFVTLEADACARAAELAHELGKAVHVVCDDGRGPFTVRTVQPA